MLEKLEGLADRYDELENQLASPNLYDDPDDPPAIKDPSRKVIFCLFMPSLIIDFLLIPLIFHALLCTFFVSGVDF